MTSSLLDLLLEQDSSETVFFLTVCQLLGLETYSSKPSCRASFIFCQNVLKTLLFVNDSKLMSESSEDVKEQKRGTLWIKMENCSGPALACVSRWVGFCCDFSHV